MVLVLSDEAHLEKVRSPLTRIMKNYRPNVEAVLHANENLVGRQVQFT